jgi:hypothetical protein
MVGPPPSIASRGPTPNKNFFSLYYARNITKPIFLNNKIRTFSTLHSMNPLEDSLYFKEECKYIKYKI